MSQPSAITKFVIGAKHVCAHKSLVKFNSIEMESDAEYKDAEERFLTFRAQLREVIQQTEFYRSKLKESAAVASKIAKVFMKISNRKIVNGKSAPSWETEARKNAGGLRTSTADSLHAVDKIMFTDADSIFLLNQKRQIESYNDVDRLIRERFLMKLEVEHYVSKIRNLSENNKAPYDKKNRNSEKLVEAKAKLSNQTDVLMRRFMRSEQLRRKVLEEDLPRLMDLLRLSYETLAANAERTMQGVMNIPSHFSRQSLQYSDHSSEDEIQCYEDITLDSSSYFDGRISFNRGNSTSTFGNECIARSPQRSASMPLQPNKYQNGNFPRQIHYTTANPNLHLEVFAKPKTQMESSFLDTSLPDQMLKGLPLAHSVKSDEDEITRNNSPEVGLALLEDSDDNNSDLEEEADGKNVRDKNREMAVLSKEKEKEMTLKIDNLSKRSISRISSFQAAAMNENVEGNEEIMDVKGNDGSSGTLRVVALFDYEAAEEGDLSFRKDDIITTTVEEWATEGWITGTCNGKTGLFPFNYTKQIELE